MTENQTQNLSLKERILASIKEAHAADRRYMDTHFSLGSAFAHCKRLEDYMTLEGRAAARMGLLELYMPSEYYNPTYQVKGDLDNINLEQFEAALAEVTAEHERTLAWLAQQKAECEERERRSVRVGKLVKVVGGRKVKRGTIGKVTDMYPNDYDRFNERVTIQDAAGVLYHTYKDNLEVILA